MKEVFCVSKIDMDHDLSNFMENVFMVNAKQNEVTIELELKELIEENEQVIIQLKYDGEIMKEIILKRR